jgi:hypothetical protein
MFRSVFFHIIKVSLYLVFLFNYDFIILSKLFKNSTLLITMSHNPVSYLHYFFGKSYIKYYGWSKLEFFIIIKKNKWFL